MKPLAFVRNIKMDREARRMLRDEDRTERLAQACATRLLEGITDADGTISIYTGNIPRHHKNSDAYRDDLSCRIDRLQTEWFGSVWFVLDAALTEEATTNLYLEEPSLPDEPVLVYRRLADQL